VAAVGGQLPRQARGGAGGRADHERHMAAADGQVRERAHLQRRRHERVGVVGGRADVQRRQGDERQHGTVGRQPPPGQREDA
jgi:hypothetical protein